ncbi:MAG TPA: TetR/AcrR family transcriptional regulator [Acidimicrobiales bacterium]|jgi:AcrR family transcriptional regulator|nr:TetR/AcrR family transcriptional regulator [Acidimicrobiales bacterium]
MPAPGALDQVDGRRLRREQNREAVIDALVSLFDEAVYQPSSAEIADRAGLSPRSLFRYFDDIDDLNRAAIDRQIAAARPLLDPGVGPDAATSDKIRGLLGARARLFDAIAPAARSARICSHRHPIVAGQVHESREFLRSQLRHLFARELSDDRAALLPALDALCSFETYELMRFDQGRSRAKTLAALTAALTTLLDTNGDTP